MICSFVRFKKVDISLWLCLLFFCVCGDVLLLFNKVELGERLFESRVKGEFRFLYFFFKFFGFWSVVVRYC